MTFTSVVLRAGLCAGLLLAPWLLYRAYVCLDQRGYLVSQRNPPSGGGVSGVLNELTRLTQPSIQHVEMVRDEAVRPERDDQAADL